LGVFSGSEKRDGVCQVLIDAGQHSFSPLGEDKIRGSAGKKEEKNERDDQGGPPGLGRGFRQRRVSFRQYQESLSPILLPGFLILPVLPGKTCRLPCRERQFRLRRSRLFLPVKGDGRFDADSRGVRNIQGIPALSAPKPYPFGPLEQCKIHMVARMATMAIDVHGRIPQRYLLPAPFFGIFPAFL